MIIQGHLEKGKSIGLEIRRPQVKNVKGLSKTNKQTSKQKFIDTDNSVVVTRGKGRCREVEEGKSGKRWWKET